jgi:hypothetical protein
VWNGSASVTRGRSSTTTHAVVRAAETDGNGSLPSNPVRGRL